MKAATVIGGAGFVGSNLACFLTEKGVSVTAMDNLSRRGSELNLPRLKQHGVVFRHGDTRHAGNLSALPTSDVVLDCSAQSNLVDGMEYPRGDFDNNLLGGWNVLEYCRYHRTPLIFWSSNKVYGAATVNALGRMEKSTRWEWLRGVDAIAEDFPQGGERGVYGATKASMEIWCKEYMEAYQLPVIVNRCSCLAGPHQWGFPKQGWFAWFVIAFALGLPLTLFGWRGKQVRDVLFIADLCALVWRQIEALAVGFTGDVFNVGGGRANTISLVELVNKLQHRFNVTQEPAYESFRRWSDQCIYISDISKAEDVFGWKPEVSIQEGLEDIERWVNANLAALSANVYLRT